MPKMWGTTKKGKKEKNPAKEKKEKKPQTIKTQQ